MLQFFLGFSKGRKRKRTEVLSGNGDKVEEEVCGEEEREPECEITARVSAVNVSQSQAEQHH